MKHNNICVMGTPEGEETEQGIKNLFEEIMAENISTLLQEKYTQEREAQRVPNKLDPKRPTPGHIIIKMTKIKEKERILKAAGEKQVVTYKGALIRLFMSSTDLFSQQKHFKPERSGVKYSR